MQETSTNQQRAHVLTFEMQRRAMTNWNDAKSYKTMHKMQDNKYEPTTTRSHIWCARSGINKSEVTWNHARRRAANRNDSDVKRSKQCEGFLRFPKITKITQDFPNITQVFPKITQAVPKITPEVPKITQDYPKIP